MKLWLHATSPRIEMTEEIDWQTPKKNDMTVPKNTWLLRRTHKRCGPLSCTVIAIWLGSGKHCGLSSKYIRYLCNYNFHLVSDRTQTAVQVKVLRLLLRKHLVTVKCSLVVRRTEFSEIILKDNRKCFWGDTNIEIDIVYIVYKSCNRILRPHHQPKSNTTDQWCCIQSCQRILISTTYLSLFAPGHQVYSSPIMFWGNIRTFMKLTKLLNPS